MTKEVMGDPMSDELVFDARRGEAIYAVECAAALVAVAEYMGFSSAIDLVRVAKDYGADTPEEVAHVIDTALSNTESIQNAWTILESNYLRARQLDWDEDE